MKNFTDEYFGSMYQTETPQEQIDKLRNLGAAQYQELVACRALIVKQDAQLTVLRAIGNMMALLIKDMPTVISRTTRAAWEEVTK